MKKIKNNIVEKYLEENKDKKLSNKNLSRILNKKNSYIYYLAKNSKNVRFVKPLEVGSLKKKIYVYQFNEKQINKDTEVVVNEIVNKAANTALNIRKNKENDIDFEII